MKETVIIYHDDNDGRCAGAIIWKMLQDRAKDNTWAVFVSANYGDVENIAERVVEGDDIYIVDFSFPPELFEKLNQATFTTSSSFGMTAGLSRLQTDSGAWLMLCGPASGPSPWSAPVRS